MREKLVITALCLLFFFPGITCAFPILFEFDVNNDAASAKLGSEINFSGIPYEVNIGGLNNEDEYFHVFAETSMQQSELIENLTLEIGGRFLWGKVEKTIKIRDEYDYDDGYGNVYDDDYTYERTRSVTDEADVMAFALVGGGTYLFDYAEEYIGLPLELSANAIFALSPFCFADADGYLELNTSLGVHIFLDGKGVVLLGYRYIDYTFDEEYTDFDTQDDAFFIGCKFRF